MAFTTSPRSFDPNPMGVSAKRTVGDLGGRPDVSRRCRECLDRGARRPKIAHPGVTDAIP